MRFPLQYCFISRPRNSTDFLPLPLNIRRQSRNPVMKIKRPRCVCEPWLNETDPTYIGLASQDRQDCVDAGGRGHWGASVLLGGHAHWDSALSLAGQGGGGRGQQGCNSGLGTHTRGGDVLSSYVYYYFFPAILQEAECDTEFNETSV